MPARFVSVAASVGDTLKKGDVLLTLKAMEMETTFRAERDCKVAEFTVKAGDDVDAKDRFIVVGS